MDHLGPRVLGLQNPFEGTFCDQVIVLKEGRIFTTGSVGEALTTKKTPDQGLLMDISHGAFELFRTASIVLETDNLQVQLQQAAESGKDLEYLEKKGAILLTKPEGWHWFTPKGEMLFLAAPGETRLAAQKLQERITRKTPAKPAPKPQTPPKAPPISTED